ncbi:MAG TPA: alpha-glucan family phosphorylase [Longimicrobiales bacterium]|nr:alpha-glucan family phosphorylase [Longimicrobiales bacterium]
MKIQDQLEELALNLRWAWHSPTRDLFRTLDPELWERVRHNPLALLRRVEPARLAALDGLEERGAALRADLDRYLDADEAWFDRGDAPADRPLTAYFSAEFGIAECLRIYSGGLGILAGDHLKSASDLGVPLVGMGILYREGYFQQDLGPGGRQTETFPAADFEDLPLREALRPDGEPVRVAAPVPGRRVLLRVWRADVGRVPLFLLDADLPENKATDRALTARLYGGDQETRIVQEIILGIGGYRALREMGISPRSFHMNEGHSAFLGLELVRDRMERDSLDFQAGVEAVRRGLVFTTHTPVPAGHDRFSPELMEVYFTTIARSMGVRLQDLLALGREDPDDPNETFTMTVLAIKLSDRLNGVSRLHGRVSREMWQPLWPDRELDDVPIDHITNGVHLPSWVDDGIGNLYGVAPERVGIEEGRPDPDPEALWRRHEVLRGRLVETIRSRTGVGLAPDALTVAFARRFATYKRATLVLEDEERLDALLNHPDRPVQLVFAGKAHPRDEGGKALIRRITRLGSSKRFRDRLVFLPGYEMDLARRLVQGADVWLNNPRRPMEASGTSGMKAAANGVLNVSILDGWWDEAWELAQDSGLALGWAVGHGREKAIDKLDADGADRRDLLRVLAEEVVPTFYDRDDAGLPRHWMGMMRDSVRVVAPFFNTNRMVRDYVERYARAAPDPVGAP